MEQVRPDDDYRHKVPLSKAHESCVARARRKSVVRRAESMRMLVLPGGGHVNFNKSTRAAIDPVIIQRIRLALMSIRCTERSLQETLCCLDWSMHTSRTRSVLRLFLKESHQRSTMHMHAGRLSVSSSQQERAWRCFIPQSCGSGRASRRELNAADEALWQHGKTLHVTQMQEHKRAGRLAETMTGLRSIHT